VGAGGSTGTDKVVVQAVETRHYRLLAAAAYMCTPNAVEQKVSAKVVEEHWMVMGSLDGNMGWTRTMAVDMQVLDSTMRFHMSNNVGWDRGTRVAVAQNCQGFEGVELVRRQTMLDSRNFYSCAAAWEPQRCKDRNASHVCQDC